MIPPRRMEQISKTSTAAKSRLAAFSVKELLLVVAVISVLLCLQLSALTGGANSAKIAQCAANLKQFVGVVQLFGDANNNVLPTITGGNWPWDMSYIAMSGFSNYGSTRQMMYCPGFPEQNIDQMWNFTPGVKSILGYASTFAGVAGIPTDDQNLSLSMQRYTLNGSDPSLGPAGATVYIPPSQRVLLADATISAPNQSNLTQASTYQWTLHTESGYPGLASWMKTPYGPWRGSSTDHMNTLTPAGGNVAMLDGHVQWRPFTNMLPRTVSGYGGDVFWW